MLSAANTVDRTTVNGSLYVGISTSTCGHEFTSPGKGTGGRCKGRIVCMKPRYRITNAYTSADSRSSIRKMLMTPISCPCVRNASTRVEIRQYAYRAVASIEAYINAIVPISDPDIRCITQA